MSINEKALELHEKLNGKIEISNKMAVKSLEELALLYSPGVAAPCLEIEKHPEKVYDYTIKNNTVLVISDGSAVLGLGNIKADAAIPVMEGKAMLFKAFANIDAFPITLATQDLREIVQTIKNIAPIAGGINLEDFSAPRCFDIEKILIDELDIPVMHDDQHGTAVVTTAALLNALKIVKKDRDAKIFINGMGSAGIAITKMLVNFSFHNFVLADKNGVIFEGEIKINELDDLADMLLLRKENPPLKSLKEGLKDCDVFIGVSAANILGEAELKQMQENPIIFAMANPNPEVTYELASANGVAVYASGRSDYPNQVNNVLAFPGIFRGALDIRAKKITEKMKMAAVEALVNLVSKEELEQGQIIPSPLNPNVVKAVASNVAKAWLEEDNK